LDQNPLAERELIDGDEPLLNWGNPGILNIQYVEKD
jgi:hypothetical protein